MSKQVGEREGSLLVISIDDQEFSWDEFGRMLCTYAGSGMRLIFVPDDQLEQVPRTAEHQMATHTFYTQDVFT